MRAGLSEEQYSDLEQGAYEAAIVPELWPRYLERLGEISHSAGGALLSINERGVHITAAPHLQSTADRVVNEGWMTRSGRAQGVISRGLVGVPRFLNEDDYFAPGEAETDPLVNEVFRPVGYGWAAGWLLQLPHGDIALMNIEQYYERGPIRGDDLARLDSLYPHMARAALLAARTDFQRVRTAIETLSAVGLPAAALTPTGRVVLANDGFTAATHIWTTRAGERLALHDRVADRMLTDSLLALKLAEAPRSIPVRLVPEQPVTAVIQIVPIRRTAHDIFGNTVAIAILSEPAAGATGGGASLVQSLFDLTPAEIAVARGIAAGQTVAQIARAHGRSMLTIRNQLKSAMAKTGTTRQLELALLIRQLGGSAP